VPVTVVCTKINLGWKRLNVMIFQNLLLMSSTRVLEVQKKCVRYCVICIQYTNHEQNIPVRTRLLMSSTSKQYSVNFYVI